MLQTISITIIAAAVVVVAIVLIPVILQIRRTACAAEKLFETVRMEIVPLSHDLTVISKEISSIVQSIHRQVDRVEEGIAAVGDAAGRLREFEEAVLTIAGGPLLKLPTVISAVVRGIGAFVRFFRRPAAE
ncbi:MAG: DUF948 domain-containing protein [Thermodesulfobacteriota bacterium]|jgi:uncharacterized protein YoxC